MQDSKRIGSDAKIRSLAQLIKTLPGAAHSVVSIGPERYNALQQKMRNVNNLLGWGHARVIENLLEQRPDCPRSLSDQFANPSIIKRSLLEKGRRIQLDQRTKAESDPAVAAASILARERFIDWLENAGRQHGIVLPRGASAQVKAAARQLVGRGIGVDPAAGGQDAFSHRARNCPGGIRPAGKCRSERLGFVLNCRLPLSCGACESTVIGIRSPMACEYIVRMWILNVTS